nr:MAG TPA: LysW biosynthesis protein LysW [Caudoviricetes sp.]
MIEYTCPKCGKILVHEIICTYPPINVVKCLGCGWRHEKKEPITYVPFPVDESELSTINKEELTINALGL